MEIFDNILALLVFWIVSEADPQYGKKEKLINRITLFIALIFVLFFKN